MNITLVLADTGRQTPLGLSVLQLGWKATVGIPLGDGEITLPEQAVVAFIAAEFAEINRTYELELQLRDAEQVQHFYTGQGQPTEAIMRRQVFIPQVMGASLAEDSLATVLFQFPMGSLRVDRIPGWYEWVCTIASTEAKGRVGFMVNQPPINPSFGAAAPGSQPG